MYTKHWICDNNTLNLVQEAFKECVLEPLRLEIKVPWDIVRAYNKGQEPVLFQKDQRAKVGHIYEIAAKAHDPAELPVVSMRVSLYDQRYEIRFDGSVTDMIRRCRNGEFGRQRFEVDFDLTVKHIERVES